MVRFNNVQFKVYDLDTIDTVFDRLASNLKSLPNYLYFPDGLPTMDMIYSDININVENLYETIISNSSKADSFEQIQIFLEDIKPKLEQHNLSLNINVLPLYIAYNKLIKDTILFGSHIIDAIQDVINKIVKEVDVNFLFEIRNSTIKKFKTDIENNINKTNRLVEKFESFESIVGISFTKFILEKVTFEIILNLKGISLMELFNSIVLNHNIPFANIKDYFKILKDFVPNNEWNISFENTIIIKILQKISNKIEYTDALIGVNNDDDIVINMVLNTLNNISREEFISQFMTILSGYNDLNNIKNTKEILVNGVFFFPKHNLNKYVLADLIMNDSLFSSLLSIDESVVGKRKSNLYIHFYQPKIGIVKANITEKIVERNDVIFKTESKEDFPIGSIYIRVKISVATNIESVHAFQSIFSKLMTVYDEKYNSIVEFYSIYIPDFEEGQLVAEIGSQQVLSLKDIAPEIFVPNYSRKCPALPTIINENQINEAINEGYEIMEFPLTEEEGIKRKYICKHIDRPYPGLRNNPFETSEKFPYIPCCFTKNQNKPGSGSKFRNYYYGEPLRKKEITQNIYVTSKIADNNKFGYLPENITKMFEIFDNDENYTYLRKGVFTNSSTFLYCLMEAFNYKTKILSLNDEDKIKELFRFRKSLATSSNAALCKQEMYNYSIDEITNIINDIDTYLDPKLFINMLQTVFECNIFIFNKTYYNGNISIPSHLKAYYRTNKNYKDTVFIFEHTGSDDINIKYPHCEIIVRWKTDTKDDIQSVFENRIDFQIPNNINKIFNSVDVSYSLNNKITEANFIDFTKYTKIILLNQSVDSEGKTRLINIKYNGKIISLLTSPIQPINVNLNENVDQEIYKNELNFIIDFLKYINITDIIQTNQEVLIKIGDINVSIPLKETTETSSLTQNITYINVAEQSYLNEYNLYEKLSRYIVEYMYWLFSKFVNENNLTYIFNYHDFNDQNSNEFIETINTFQTKYIIIKPDFVYKNVSKIFSFNNGVMFNNKLVVKSLETLKRLFYVLRLTIIRNPNKIKNYHLQKMIEGYYVDITDFDQYFNQIILKGQDSIEKLINKHINEYKLSNKIILDTNYPYFFKNNYINKDSIYLAQNTDSYFKAINICLTWEKEHYNISQNAKENRLVKFNLYSYTNSNNIKKYIINGEQTEYDINIIGYKKDNKSYFTALLKL